MSTTREFLTSLQTSFPDPVDRLAEIDRLLAKAKAAAVDLQERREAAENTYVDAVNYAHLTDAEPPKMPLELARLRESEGAAETMVDILSAERGIVLGHARNSVGNKLTAQAKIIGDAYKARAGRALATVRAGYQEYFAATGSDPEPWLIQKGLEKSKGPSAFQEATGKIMDLAGKANEYQFGLSPDQFMDRIIVNPDLDEPATQHITKFINPGK